MLNLTKGEDFIKKVLAGAQFTLPNGDVVSPAYEGWGNGEYTLVEAPIEPALEPGPEPVPASMSFAQLMIGLVTEKWITEAEGNQWLMGGLPAAVLDVIATLPPDQQFAARARATRPSEVLRNDPLVNALGTNQEEIDRFFRTYSGV